MLGITTTNARVGGFRGKGIDADAAAFFDRVTAAGGTLTATERTAINKLVKDMKSANVWNSMKAIYPMVGASAAACAQNLKSSSFTGTFNGGWTYASTGVTPNGTNTFMDTALNQQTNLTNTDLHCSHYFNAGTFSGGSGEIGINTSNTFLLVRTGSIFFNQCDADFTVYNNTSFGFATASRTSNILRKGYFNGNLVRTTNGGVINATANLNYFIGAINTAGVATNFSTLRCALASIGTGLSDAQAASFYTSVQAFQTTLSRQV
jgi:hypothetical protein